MEGGAIQRGLFDERNLFELTHPDLPGERLVACRNPELARRRESQRRRLLEATTRELEKVRRMVTAGRLQGQEQIGKRVRQVLGQYRLGKHYRPQIGEDGFEYRVEEEAIAAELAQAANKSPELAQRRRQRYARHRQAIDQQLEHLRQRIQRGRLYGKEHSGVRVGKVLNKYKVGKHFQLHIEEDRFDFEIDPEKVQAEAALDGLYVVRTFRVQALEVAHQQETKVDPRGHARASHPRRVELRAQPLHEAIKPVFIQDRIQSPVEGVPRWRRQLRMRNPHRTLTLSLAFPDCHVPNLAL